MSGWKGNVALILVLWIAGTYTWDRFVHEPHQVEEKRATALCSTLIGLVERSQETIRTHPYYKRNPAELPEALHQNSVTLRKLRNACP